MLVLYVLQALLTLATTQTGKADTSLTLLSGAIEPADLVRVSATEVVVKKDDKEKRFDTAGILYVDFGGDVLPLPATPHIEVRLVDGSHLRCNAAAIRGREIELHLFNGLSFKCPLDVVRHVLCEAQDESNRAEFKQLLARNTAQDILRLASRDGATINTFEGVIGEADAKGETLKFKTEDTTASINMNRVRGLIFSRRASERTSNAACKLIDRCQNTLVLARVDSQGEEFTIGLTSGVELKVPRSLISRLDFSMGKLAFLSDLEPVLREFRFGVKEDLVKDLPEKYGRDATLFTSKNGTSRQIRIGQRGFSKGLNIHSPTILEFDVSGYNWFRCILGMDDGVTRPGRAGVRIEGDGKELFGAQVTGGDKPREIELNISGVKRLKLAVDRGDDDDELGDHISFGDARITK